MKEGHKNIAKAFSTQGRATHLKRGYGLCAALKTPVLPFTNPQLRHNMSVPKTLIWKKNVKIFPKANIFLFKKISLWQFSAPEAQIWPQLIFVKEIENSAKYQF